MNDILLDLPAHVRERLSAALDNEELTLTESAVAVSQVLSDGKDAERVAEALHELRAMGMSPKGAAVALRAIGRVNARQRKPDLVLSGLQVDGIYSRDTRQVFDELIGAAERSIWISSYVYHNGPKVFETLARRMEQRPELSVNLLLNIQRKWGDTTASDHLVHEFARDFWNPARGWPGARRPRVYYDPRSLDLDDLDERAVLHAKAVVVDDEGLFITSANLTEAANKRNVEMGVLLRDRGMALTVVTYFQRLIDERRLLLLPERPPATR